MGNFLHSFPLSRTPVVQSYYWKNTKTVIFGPFLYFLTFFVFSGANLGWGILHFFRHFFVFPGFRVLWGSVPPPQDRKTQALIQVGLDRAGRKQ